MLMRVLHQKNHSSWILLRHGVSRRSLFRDPTKDNELARLLNTTVFLCMKEMSWALANA